MLDGLTSFCELDCCWVEDFEALVNVFPGFNYADLTDYMKGMVSVCSDSKFVFHNITIESAPPVAK